MPKVKSHKYFFVHKIYCKLLTSTIYDKNK